MTTLIDHVALTGEDCDSCGMSEPVRACIECGNKFCGACADLHGCGGGIGSDDDEATPA